MRKAILLIAALFALFIFKKDFVFAQNSYSVKAYIVIPSDVKKPADIVQKYKQYALRGLEEVKQFYSTKLQGHSFTYSSNVVEIDSTKSMSSLNLQKIGCVAEVDDGLGEYFPFNGEISVVFTLGSGNMMGCGWGDLKTGAAWLSEDTLARLGSTDISYHNYGIGYLAHEIGHAFGLVNAGWSGGHPCTATSQQECVNGPVGLGTTIPYPSGDEAKYSIIGSGADFYGGPESSKIKFNNTESSPEIWKLYQSLYINPNRDAAPAPTKDFIDNQPPGIITDVTPSNASPGDTVRILGTGFGASQGWVDIYKYPRPQFSITNWKDTEIDLVIKSIEQSEKTDFNFSVRTSSSGDFRYWPQIYTSKVLSINPPQSAVSNPGSPVTQSPTSSIPLIISSITPNTVTIGQKFNVLGGGFGATSDGFSFDFSDSSGRSGVVYSISITKWNNTNIEMNIGGADIKETSQLNFTIKNNFSGQRASVQFTLIAQATPTPTQSPTPSPHLSAPPSINTSGVDSRIPAGKIPYSWDLDQGCRNLGGTKCFAGSFQALCTEAGGISIGQGAAGGCPDDTYRCCKYVTSCEKDLNGQCASAFDKTNVQFQNEPTHTRLSGYCSTDLYDWEKSGDANFLSCWNKPGVTPQSPNTTPQSTSPAPSPSSSPVTESLTQNCNSRGGVCAGTTCLVNNDPAGECDSESPSPSASTQPKKKSITKITINDGKNVKEITSNFDQALSIDLPGTEGVAQIFQVSVTIVYDDGSTPTNLPFTFTYEPNGPSTNSSAPTSSISTDEAVCNAKGGVCQASCDGTKFSAQVGTCPSKNQLCCATPVTAPSPSASKCPGSGTPQKDWGGPCSPNDKDVAVSANGGTACSVASCYFNPDVKQYCWYNSGTPYADYSGCLSKGVTITTPPPIAAPVVQPTVSPTTAPGFAKTGPCYQPGYDSNICGTNPGGAGGQCDSLGQQSAPISCTKTCPDGSQATGTSISTCGADGCYTNTCSCNASCSIQ